MVENERILNSISQNRLFRDYFFRVKNEFYARRRGKRAKLILFINNNMELTVNELVT